MMARTKKISEEQFVLDVINKQYEICGNEHHFDTFADLKAYTDKYDEEHKEEHKKWFQEYSFDTIEKYLEWRNYFLDHSKEWLPARIPMYQRIREFSWFSLQYGFSYGFDVKELMEVEKKQNISIHNYAETKKK